MYRRKRADIIEVFKIMKGFDNVNKDLFFSVDKRGRTRGHTLKLIKPQVNSNMRLHSFSRRVINIWNSLPESVISAETIDTFKNRLNEYWKNDPGKFDPTFVVFY